MAPRAVYCGVLLLLLNLSQVAHGHGNHNKPPPATHKPGGEKERPKYELKPEQVYEAVKKSDDIKQHYENVANIDFDKMTDKEITFHFFKLHDFDQNQMLDGLEIIKGLAHVMEHADDGGYYQQDFDEMVDHMLKKGDKNQDGFLTYAEYSMSDIFNIKNPYGVHNY